MSYLDLLNEEMDERRVPKLTLEAALEKTRRLKAHRAAACGKVTGKTNEIKALIKDKRNLEQVKEILDRWSAAFYKLKISHHQYVECLEEGEEEELAAKTWAEQRYKEFDQFSSEVKLWLHDVENNLSQDQDNVLPKDSASQVSSKSGAGSVNSRASSVGSSLARARLEAAMKKAELKARSESLKKKQALEEENLLLQRKREQLEINTEIAAENAKLSAIEEIEKDLVGQVTSQVHVADKTKQSQQTKELNPEAKSFVTNKSMSHQVQEMKETVLGESTEEWYYNIAKQQTELTKLLVEQQMKATLPQRSIPAFSGNPLEYSAFMRAFEYGIEDKTSCAKDRLYYLEQYTNGEANSLVRSCTHMSPEDGFKEAKRLLRKRYGNKFKIAESFLQKARGWQEIKSEDEKTLSSFAVFLRECYNTMQDLEYMQEIDHASHIQVLVSKLPYKLRDRWRTKTDIIQEEIGRAVRFVDLVEFVEKQARIISNPIYGNVQGDFKNQERKGYGRKQEAKTRNKGASFATLTSSAYKVPPPKHQETETKEKCLFCQERDHSLAICTSFQKKTMEQRLKFVKDEGLCFGCLKRAAHIARDCKKKLTCDICQRRHPTALHRKEWDKKEESSNEEAGVEEDKHEEKTVKANCGYTDFSEEDCAQTVVPVMVGTAGGPSVLTYAFLDNGSNAVFCSKDLMKKLQIKGQKTKLQIQTLNKESVSDSLILSGLIIRDLDAKNELQLPKVYVQDTIPIAKENIPTQEDISKWGYLKNVHIHSIDADVGLLIGRNVPKASEPCQVVGSQSNGPYACRTRFGWAVYGLMKKSNFSQKAVVHRVITTEHDTEKQIKKLFNHEFGERLVDEKPEKSIEDHQFLAMMERSSKLENGHYELCLPLRDCSDPLPNNRVQAEARLNQLRKKFQKQPSLFSEYKTFMENIIQQGYAEEVPTKDLNHDRKVWYLPHHSVRHPRKQKLRVVYDCAAEFRGVSLNKELLQGPDLTSSLVGVLTRFREERVAVMADIEAMFSQIKVPKGDRDLLRFLWWPCGDIEKPVLEYRMTSHIFGATSSPSCASYALQKAAKDNASPTEIVYDTVMKAFYVDDCLKCLPSEEEAIHLVRDLTRVCQSGGFRLTKWISNSKRVLETVDETERAKEVNNIDLEKDSLPTERALGMLWCADSDKFKYKIEMKEKPLTRRGILSTVSSIYDPMGLAAAAILPAKIVLQDLCRQKFEWDQEISEERLSSWQGWLSGISRLEEFQIDRCLKPPDFGELSSVELHHFSDASELGYGTVSYLWMQNHSKEVHCTLLMGKARVAPLKQITIPRLELAAATVAVKVNSMLKKELTIPIDETFFWTDSKTVLRYIRNEAARFHTFVANRVAIIRDGSDVSQWRYVPSEENPADDCSRGMAIDKFLHSRRWLNGPEFLWEHQSARLREDPFEEKIPTSDPEIRVTMHAITTTMRNDSVESLLQHFSSWHKLKKTVAWILRIKQELRERVWSTKGKTSNDPSMEVKDGISTKKSNLHKKGIAALTTKDLRNAEEAIVKYVQRSTFDEEIKVLTSSKKDQGSTSRNKALKGSSSLWHLDPFLEDDMLKVGGRLRRAAIPSEAKHPIILPKESRISELILYDIHESTGHMGRNCMLARLHERYWMVGANAAARKIVGKCISCKKQRARPVEQKMADLPAGRLAAHEPPFSYVGVDYFGPIEVKQGRSMVKRYGVVFTCLAIRAVHLEKADSLDTDSCINAIMRFISRRGPVKEIRSDNGTNFVGAEREMRKEIDKWNQAKIHESMLQRGIDWVFNPPSGSHFGGVWERQIRTIRKIMCSVAKEQTQSDEGDPLH